MSSGLILMVVGMAVVFASLSLLLAVIVLLRRIFAGTSSSIEEGEHRKKAAQEPDQPQEKHIDSQLIAILTAAATVALGARIRVFRVGFVGDESNSDHAWVQQARSELHMSHRRKRY
jgi:sodium pump decarboxylase gamma subunit